MYSSSNFEFDIKGQQKVITLFDNKQSG